jgi:putative transposase
MILDECRWLWNHNLNERIEHYKQDKKSLSNFDQNYELPSLKKERSSLKNVHANTLQNVNERLDKAYKAFFRRVKNNENPGFPRFKSRHNTRGSFTYAQSGFSINENRVFLSKIGHVKFVRHRDIEGTIKQCVVKRCHDEYYVIFVCELDDVQPVEIQSIVGLDLGVENFATLSDGNVIPNPRISREQVAKCQRKHSKKKTEKTRRALQKSWKRLVNRREDFTHKLSRFLVNKYDCIVVEDLNIQRMVTSDKTNRNLNREVMDATWNSFIQKLIYKAESAGKRVVKVDPAYTSQRCSQCGEIVAKDLSVRIHSCPTCNLTIHRDLNAALNIKALALQSMMFASRCPYL